ncbi:hypothetical protein RRG08_054250 [Elysia crispata]|uniref:Uncharacterized protein n=1 Tax=Elysia crispata TaxID=231223 RepID=A0AAE0YCB4_9GAST|nr:hypothetical protein RRG08_054250 [Elysia crispata]
MRRKSMSLIRTSVITLTIGTLQRFRTAENLRLGWDNSGGPGPQRQHSHLFSWDDDFWKTGSRRSPQSVASSASTFEEVESLCFSRSSSDSFNSSLRHWDQRYTPGVGWAGSSARPVWFGGGGAGVHPSRVGTTPWSSSSRRQRISRQSSTTSTSTSRSSAGAGAAGGDDDLSDQSRRASQDTYGRSGDHQSIKGKLLESMEFLGSSGNLDLADKLYLEKIFHRALGQNQSQSEQPPILKSALKKPHNYAPPEVLSGNEVLLERLQRLKHHRLLQRESGSAPASATSSPVLSIKRDKFEKKRRKDLILPDEEEPPSSKRYQWTPASEQFNKRKDLHKDRYEAHSHSRHQNSDSYSKSSLISSMSSFSMENGSLRASPVGSVSPASPSKLPEQHPNLATFLTVNQPMQRVPSVDSAINGATSEGAYNVFSQPFTPSHAERVLMGLGFGAAEGFLPERFLKDWYNKISRAQSDASSGAGNGSMDAGGVSNADSKDVTGRNMYMSKSISHDGYGSNYRPQALVSSDKVSFRSQPILQRHDSHVSSVSSVLDEAASYLPKGGDRSSRNERIGDYVAAQSAAAHQLPQGGGLNSRALKMRQFANDRQKSLPLHLETLTEEDELRIRKSGLDPFDKEARLQMFISDTLSNSGKSSNSEQSRCGSNQSESDSLSSCSEMIDAYANPEMPEWQQSKAFRKQQEQIPTQLQQLGRQPTRKTRPHTDGKKAILSHNHQISNKKQNKKNKCVKSDVRDEPSENGENLDRKYMEDENLSQAETADTKPSTLQGELIAGEMKSKDKVSTVNDKNNDHICHDELKSTNQRNVPKNSCKDKAMQHEKEDEISPRRVQPVNQSMSITSGESFEVADIMQNQKFAFNRGSRIDGNPQSKHRTRRGTTLRQNARGSNSPPSTTSDETELSTQKNPSLKAIEPAMVSIILEDVDQDSDGNRQSQELAMIPQEGNHLNIPPSRCSSSSLSPIPQSPVTVIEVGQLDNQQDSLDTESTGSSRESGDEVCSSENSGISRSGRKSKHGKRGHKQKMLSPTSLKALQIRRRSEHLVPQLSVNDEPLESRRFSLDVPTVARLQRISEQRLQELNGQLSKQDDEEESISPSDLSKRRGSSRRTSFSEEKPVIINEFLANKDFFQSLSPQRRKSYEVQASEDSMDISSHRKKSKSRERRLSRSVSPSPSPTSPRTLSPSPNKGRESPVRRPSRHRHRQLRKDEVKSERTDCKVDKEIMSRESCSHDTCDENQNNDAFEICHCCCRRNDHHSKSKVQTKTEHNESHPKRNKNDIQSHKVTQCSSLETQSIDNNTYKPKPTDNNVSSEQNEMFSRQVLQDSLSHINNPYLDVFPNEKQSPRSQFKLFAAPRSIDSSPGSARSAFTSTGRSGSKSLLSMPAANDYQSETDIDEFPATVKLTLHQRPISSFTKNIMPGANPFRRNSSSSSLISLKGNGFNPNVLFSSSPKRDFHNLEEKNFNGKSAIHTISRAVQTSCGQLNDSYTQQFSAHTTSKPQIFYYMAKDQGTQCGRDPPYSNTFHRGFGEHGADVGLHCGHTRQLHLPEKHVHVYDKFTQTRVACYEMSSQTEWIGDQNSWTPLSDSSSVDNVARNFCAHAMKNPTVSIKQDLNGISELSFDTCNNHNCLKRNDDVSSGSSGNKMSLNFNVIDETIELIEAELLQINTKQRHKPNICLQQAQGIHNHNQLVSTSSKEHQTGTTSFPSRNVIRDTVDKRLTERYAPSTWTDATRLSPFHDSLQHLAQIASRNPTPESSKKNRVDYSPSNLSSHGKTNVKSALNSIESPKNEVRLNKFDTDETLTRNLSFPEKQISNPLIKKPIIYSRHLQTPLSNLQNTSLFQPTNGRLESTACNASDSDTVTFQPALNFSRSHLDQSSSSSKCENDANSNKANSERSYPSVASKDLIVKMYELQQDLTSYLKPCEGMYGEKDVKRIAFSDTLENEQDVLDDGGGKENAQPVLNLPQYDFSIENANTSSGFSYLFRSNNKAKRRFSTPAVCDGAHWARTHSKLSRLKYQNNSHQNSFNSLDIEVDFMNAGEPLGSYRKQQTKNSSMPLSFESMQSFTNDAMSQVSSRSVAVKKVETKSSVDGRSEIAKKEKFALGDEIDNILKLPHEEYPANKSRSPKIIVPCAEKQKQPELPQRSALLYDTDGHVAFSSLQFLSPRDSVASSCGISPRGFNTPEIVISPMESARTAFLTVPHSPQDVLLKARFPSVSSSPSAALSPNILEASAETNMMNPGTSGNCNLNSVLSHETSKTLENIMSERIKSSSKYMVRGSITSSILDSSTFSSLTDISNFSSVDKQSMSSVSKLSMSPHLSTETSTDMADMSGLHPALDDLSDEDIGILESKHDAFNSKTLKLRRHLSLLDKKALKDDECLSGAESDEDAVDSDNNSNLSLAGSEESKDVDDMEVMVHQSRVMRCNSSSTYSEPELDLIDGLSDDSLATSLSDSEDVNTTGTFLTVSGMSKLYSDDLLQVSDYGGYSPSLSRKVLDSVASSPDSITSASACINDTRSRTVKSDYKSMDMVSLRRQELQKAFSESWVSTDCHIGARYEKDTHTPKSELGEEGEHIYDELPKHQHRRGSKDNWHVVHALIKKQNESQSQELSNAGEGKSNEFDCITFGNQKVPHFNLELPDDTVGSSGDECDKEITLINHNFSSARKPRIKTHSDPVNKVLYCELKDKDQKNADAVESHGGTKVNIQVSHNDKEDREIESSSNETYLDGIGNSPDIKSGAKPLKDHGRSANEKTKIGPPNRDSSSIKSDETKKTTNTLKDSAMLEVFQNADLSVLKDAAGLGCKKLSNKIRPSSPALQLHFSFPSSDLVSDVDNDADRGKEGSSFFPRVVGMDYSSDEESREQILTFSDKDLTYAISHDDLDSGLTEDLELVLSKSGDEFDELTNSLLVKDTCSLGGPDLLHTPLSQITEEDTQSECSISEASGDLRLKVWQVRNRFVSSDMVKAHGLTPQSHLPSSELTNVKVATTPTTESEKVAVQSSISETLEEGKSYPRNHTLFSRDPEIDIEIRKNSATSQLSSNLQSEDIKTSDSNDKCRENSEFHTKRKKLNGCSENDSTELYDDPFYTDEPDETARMSVTDKDNPKCLDTLHQTTSNLEFSRSRQATTDLDSEPKYRALSHKSGIFKFAQALLEDAMVKAKAEHTEKASSSRQDLSHSTFSKPEMSHQVVDTKILERTWDNVGTVTTKVSSTKVTTRSNLVISNKTKAPANVFFPEEKHISTTTIQMGDYRDNKAESGSDLVELKSSERSTRLQPNKENTIDLARLSDEEETNRAETFPDDSSLSAKGGPGEMCKYLENGKKDSKGSEHDPSDSNMKSVPDKKAATDVLHNESNLIKQVGENSQITKLANLLNCGFLVGDKVQETQASSGDQRLAEQTSEVQQDKAQTARLKEDETFGLSQEMSEEDADISATDLKSRVKAMLLIDYGKAPGSSDSSIKDELLSSFEPARSRNLLVTTGSESSNASSSPLRRVKVTTMFSQASEDGGLACMSSSIPDSGSEADKSPGSDLEEAVGGSKCLRDKLDEDTVSPKRNIRIQHPQSSDLLFRTQSSGGGRAVGEGRKQLKTLRSRDSLLKLHQQTHVYSSAGSDSDSDLQSVLRSQKQVRPKVRETDIDSQGQDMSRETESSPNSRLVVKQEKKKDDDKNIKDESRFLKVEPDKWRGRKKLGSPEPNQNCPISEDRFNPILNAENPDASVRRMSSSSGSSLGTSMSNPPTPKVIVQQPSEDAQVFTVDKGNIFVFPHRISAKKIFSRGKEETEGANDNHLHSECSTAVEVLGSVSIGQNKQPPSPGSIRPRGPRSLISHRPKRPQFLSPNSALRSSYPEAFIPTPNVAPTREEDSSHPELAYLDIVSRMKSASNLTHTNADRTGQEAVDRKPVNVSPPCITKTDFTKIDTNSSLTGSTQSLRFRNLGSPEPHIAREDDELVCEDPLDRLDLFPPSSAYYTKDKNIERPGLSIVISSDLSELASVEPHHGRCGDELESFWPEKSLSVASKDSGFDSQSQGSPSDMSYSQKFSSVKARSIDIVKEESET